MHQVVNQSFIIVGGFPCKMPFLDSFVKKSSFLTNVVKIVLLFKFPNVLHKDFKVIGIVLFLRSIQAKPLSQLRLVVDTDIEKHRDDVEFHILKPPALGSDQNHLQNIQNNFQCNASEVKSDNVFDV